MPRVSEIEGDGGEGMLQPIFAKERELFGGPLNPTKIYAHRPPVLKAMKDMAVRVALLNGCPF